MPHPRPSSSFRAGPVSSVQGHGTIVVVTITSDGGGSVPVYFDHRQFRQLLEGEGCGPEELVGRPASYDGAAFRLLD